jgi:hypothetical protein
MIQEATTNTCCQKRLASHVTWPVIPIRLMKITLLRGERGDLIDGAHENEGDG